MPGPVFAEAVLRALHRFGAPLHNLTKEDITQRDGTIFQIGVAPRRIDIITSASGLKFEPAYRDSIPLKYEGTQVHIPELDEFFGCKILSEDLPDVEGLESVKNSIILLNSGGCFRGKKD